MHQIVVPRTLDLELGESAEQHALYQIVIEIGVRAGLEEGIERCARGAAANEPGLKIGVGRIGGRYRALRPRSRRE
jgi:hypothetical protein